MNYDMDNAFHDCFAQCWLCNRAALSLRNKEPKMTPVQSRHSRQSEKHHIHFLDSNPPELMAVISFLTCSAGKLMAMFFSITDAVMPPTEETPRPALYPTAGS